MLGNLPLQFPSPARSGCYHEETTAIQGKQSWEATMPLSGMSPLGVTLKVILEH